MSSYTMPNEQDLNDLKSFLDERIVTINIKTLIQWYCKREDRLKARIRELERELREAHLNNAEKLFRDLKDD